MSSRLPINKTTLLYGAGLALAAFALQWLDYQHTVRRFATELYIILIAVAFTMLGAWIGHRLTRRHPDRDFQRNERALEALAISKREYGVLELLACGLSNKEIAARLFVSPNTIKTHLARLYEKLEVSSRAMAIQKARALRLIP